jgi:hypothetical protein
VREHDHAFPAVTRRGGPSGKNAAATWSFELAFIPAVIIAARGVTITSNFHSGLCRTVYPDHPVQ